MCKLYKLSGWLIKAFCTVLKLRFSNEKNVGKKISLYYAFELIKKN